MKVFKISVSGMMLGVVVDKNGTMTPGAALNFWNQNAGPSYQGDSATGIKFFSV